MPGGLFTDRVFGSMKEREKMTFEGPLGSFFLRESDKPAVFLASGTGYAPIRAILQKAFARDTNRKMVLYWGARSLKDIYMFDEAQKMSEQHANLSFIPVLSEALPEDGWTGRTGFVHRAVLEDIDDLANWQVYACGTPLMVEAARRDFCAESGLREEEFYADSFVSEADLARAALADS
jgi:CDP-4-dehydro-6-deoxyglucose reductase